MPTYKGNKGNLLQHWVLCELLSAAREHVSRLQFIDAHAMAPVAEKQEDKHKDSVFDSVRARLPGQGSYYERAWKELVPHGETGYPNSGLPQNLWAEWRIGSPSSDPQRARVLAAVKARRSAPAARGDGLDAGSAHAGPGSCGSPERGVGELRPVRGAPG